MSGTIFTGASTRPNFNLVQDFLGYRNKEDKTKLAPGWLIEGSQNVLLTSTGKIAPRKGYVRIGQDSASTNPILSSFDWERRTGEFRNLRSGDEKLQFLYNSTWYDLMTGLGTNVLFRYSDWWNGVDSALKTTELKAFLLMCNGTDKLFEWSGGITTVSSSTATTITKSGTTTWSEDGFYNTNKDKGDATTEFTITNPSGTTFRYTWTTVGTDPVISATTFPVGAKLYIKGQNFNAGNNGVFTITASGANYFEVTNAAGVAEATKTIGTGFLTMYPSQLLIGTTTFTYHGGGDTTTITDVTPSAATLVADDLVFQAVKEFPISAMAVNSGFTAVPKKIDNIAVLKQQLYIIDDSYRFVYVSKLNDFLDYSFTTPVRIAGEGALITLDGNPKVLIPQEEEMYISASTNQWYKTKFVASADLTGESLSIERLKTAYQKGALTQEMVTKVINDVMFINNEPTLEKLGRIEGMDTTPMFENISDSIRNDFDAYDFTDGQLFYYKNFIYMSFPKESIVRIYNIEKQNWEAPQIMPISRFSVIDNELYGHSYVAPISYKLFTGHKDDADPTDDTKGTEINAIAVFSYQNFGTRELQKKFNQYYVEGYIQENTTLTCGINYEIEGALSNLERTISGTDKDVISLIPDNASLGKNPFGLAPLGGALGKDAKIYTSSDLPNKFRVIFSVADENFYECSFYFKTYGNNFRWEIAAFGPLITSSMYNNAIIKV
jgi:hypothetical protein